MGCTRGRGGQGEQMGVLLEHVQGRGRTPLWQGGGFLSQWVRQRSRGSELSRKAVPLARDRGVGGQRLQTHVRG